MDITYRNYTNGSHPFLRGYEPGDVLIAGWSGQIKISVPLDALDVCEQLFMKHNRDDRPDGQMCPSMSIGDVVVLGENAFTVADIGFDACSIDPADIVADLTWCEWIDTPAAIAAMRAR